MDIIQFCRQVGGQALLSVRDFIDSKGIENDSGKRRMVG